MGFVTIDYNMDRYILTYIYLAKIILLECENKGNEELKNHPIMIEVARLSTLDPDDINAIDFSVDCRTFLAIYKSIYRLGRRAGTCVSVKTILSIMDEYKAPDVVDVSRFFVSKECDPMATTTIIDSINEIRSESMKSTASLRSRLPNREQRRKNIKRRSK